MGKTVQHQSRQKELSMHLLNTRLCLYKMKSTTQLTHGYITLVTCTYSSWPYNIQGPVTCGEGHANCFVLHKQPSNSQRTWHHHHHTLIQWKPLRSSYWLHQRASQQVNCWCKHAILWNTSPGVLHCTEHVALHAPDGNGPHSI